MPGNWSFSCASFPILQKIHSYPQNKNVQKALIAAQYAGVDIEEPQFEYGVTNKTEAFKKLTPIGKVPAPACPCLSSPCFCRSLVSPFATLPCVTKSLMWQKTTWNSLPNHSCRQAAFCSLQLSST